MTYSGLLLLSANAARSATWGLVFALAHLSLSPRSARGDYRPPTPKDAVCQGIATPLVSSDTPANATSAYRIAKDGVVEVGSEFKVSEAAISFDLGAGSVVVRFSAADPVTGDVQKLACGELAGKKSVSLQQFGNQLLAKPRLLVIDVFHTRGPALPSKSQRAILAEIEPIERVQVTGRVAKSLDNVQRAIQQGDRASALSAIAEAGSTTQTLMEDLGCTSSTAQTPLTPFICDEAAKLQGILASVANVVLAQADAGSAAITTLHAPGPLSDAQLEEHCANLAKLRWMMLEDVPRLATRAEIPLVDRDDLLVVNYGTDDKKQNVVTTERKLGLLVLSAPVAGAASFGTHQGDAIASQNLAELLDVFLPAAAKAMGIPLAAMAEMDSDGSAGGESTELILGEDAEKKPDPTGSLFGAACRTRAKARDSTVLGDDLLIDATVPPSETAQTLGFLFGPIDADHNMQAAVCEGATCSAGPDDQHVKSRVTLTPKGPTAKMTLLVDFTAGVPCAVRHKAHDAPSLRDERFAPQSAPGFVPVGGAGGADQLFQMQTNASATHAFSMALLLAANIQGFVAGAGPSLLVGGSAKALQQWNARVGYCFEALAPLCLVAGPSFRFVSVPRQYSIGDVIAVPQMSPGSAKAPDIATRESLVFQFDFGIAVDFGKATSQVTSAVGGGK